MNQPSVDEDSEHESYGNVFLKYKELQKITHRSTFKYFVIQNNFMGSTKPITLRIEEEELKKLEDLSRTEGLTRSALIKKAIKTYILDYGKKTPELSEISENLTEMENKYETLLTRVNILTRQVDNLTKRRGP